MPYMGEQALVKRGLLPARETKLVARNSKTGGRAEVDMIGGTIVKSGTTIPLLDQEDWEVYNRRGEPTAGEAETKPMRQTNEAGVVQHWDPVRKVYVDTFDEHGKLVKGMPGFMETTNANGDLVWIPKTAVQSGTPTGGQGRENQSVSREERSAVKKANDDRRDRDLRANESAANTVNSLYRGDFNAATAGYASLGLPVPPGLAQQIKTNVQTFIDDIETERKRRLKESEALYGRDIDNNNLMYKGETTDIERRYRGGTTPPPPAPRQAAAPAAGKKAPVYTDADLNDF
jgi:hypothetical protein